MSGKELEYCMAISVRPYQSTSVWFHQNVFYITANTKFSWTKSLMLLCKQMLSCFNISKAFDTSTVSHGVLLNKVRSVGITGILWTWFKDYLSNRYQRVTINNYYSNLLPAVSGVPQGSILGPLYCSYFALMIHHHMSIAAIS